MTKIKSQDQVLDAAEKIFAERGLEGTRLEDIATELGVLQGSLYYHIDSKAGLIRLVRARRMQRVMEELKDVAAGAGTAQEKLRIAVHVQMKAMEWMLPNPLAAYPWFQGAPGRSEAQIKEDQVMGQDYRGIWESILVDGIESGAVRPDIDLHLTVVEILGVLNWTANWYKTDGRLSMEQIAERHFEFVWASIAKTRRSGNKTSQP